MRTYVLAAENPRVTGSIPVLGTEPKTAIPYGVAVFLYHFYESKGIILDHPDSL